MKQKLIIVLLAAASIATTGLVLIKGVAENADYQQDHSQHVQAGTSMGSGSSLQDDFGPAPAFTLVNQDAMPVTLDNFKGKAVIAGFIFTRCQGPCPLISAQMSAMSQKLAQGPLADKVMLVSFSVDPEYDTPSVLKEYAQRFEANTSRWWFLTGDRADMWKLVGSGFKLALEDQPDDKQSPILHSTKLIFIDPQGKVRGHYDALDKDSRQQLLADVNTVMTSQAVATRAGESK